MISVRFQGKSFNITVIQAYDTTTNAKEAKAEQLYDEEDIFFGVLEGLVGLHRTVQLPLLQH